MTGCLAARGRRPSFADLLLSHEHFWRKLVGARAIIQNLRPGGSRWWLAAKLAVTECPVCNVLVCAYLSITSHDSHKREEKMYKSGDQSGDLPSEAAWTATQS